MPQTCKPSNKTKFHWLCFAFLNLFIPETWSTKYSDFTPSSLSLSAVASPSCGGILETNAGSLRYDVNGEIGNPAYCVWIIKLPPTPAHSLSIQFRLDKIPHNGRLHLYPQDDYVPGQYTILPIGLSSANESSVVETRGSVMLAVWNTGDSSLPTVNSELIFRWTSIRQQNEKTLVNFFGGVGYQDGSAGGFSWERPGEYQETLLWILNSKSEGSIDLRTDMELEGCDLADPCLCSYFGVYQVLENSLRAVTTNCGMSASSSFEKIKSTLVVLAFVSTEFQRDSNHITLSWKPSQSDATTTTTTMTTTQSVKTTTATTTTIRESTQPEVTTENEETTIGTTTSAWTTTTNAPVIATRCPLPERIYPCFCSSQQIECTGVTQENVNRMMTEYREVNGALNDQLFLSNKTLSIHKTSMTSFDLSPLLHTGFRGIYFSSNARLSRIHGPLYGSGFQGSPTNTDNLLQKVPDSSAYLSSIETNHVSIYISNVTDEGLTDFFHYFSPALSELNLYGSAFEFLSKEKFEPFLQMNPQNSIYGFANRFVCDERMKWLKDGRASYEHRVKQVDCTNDKRETIFTTNLV